MVDRGAGLGPLCLPATVGHSASAARSDLLVLVGLGIGVPGTIDATQFFL